MDDFKILEAVEKYINGQMSPDERVYFESLRKTNQEIDQLVVEHTFFLQQITRYDNIKGFKALLNDTHTNLAEKGAIKSPKLQGKAKVVYLFNRYKRTAAIAASIAGITALVMSSLIWSVADKAPANDVAALNRTLNQLKENDRILNKEINEVKKDIGVPAAPVYKTGGTSFLIDAKGYLVTNAHVVKGARSIAVQNGNGRDFTATVVFNDAARDLAILKITDSAFKSPGTIPYSIKKSTAEIAEPIFTLGFPRNDVVYGEGYLAARTGYNGDTLSCQIAIAANPGNSGGPILNGNGEVIGVLSAKQTSAEGVVFATQSKYIYTALAELQKDAAFQKVKLPATSSLKGMDKTKQVKKISQFVYMVKVS